MSIDPLAQLVTLLQPSARFSKLVEGAGSWRIHRRASGEPFYCAVLEGQCMISVDGQPPITLQAGDFVLVPAMRDMVNTSLIAPAAETETAPLRIADDHFRIGRADLPPQLRMRIGHCSFASPDAALLVPLLPQLVLVRDEARLSALVQMVGEETRARRPAREIVLERLLEVLLIEALRCGTSTASAPGLARGLADERMAAALCAIHARPEHEWSVAQLAAEAALSRSAFFARFSHTVGMAPMGYVLAWRMALAKRMLRQQDRNVEQVAAQVGYGSASAFSVAFTRHVGVAPGHYMRTANLV